MNYSTNLRTILDEAALYDRQIRLWGLEAQQKYALGFIICYKAKY